jgi:hypothetical protein
MGTRLLVSACAALFSSAAYGVQVQDNPRGAPVTLMSARITWQTDVASDSQVDYGLTDGYGYSVYDPAYTTNHQVTVPLYDSDAVYEYRVTSTDGGTEAAVGYGYYYNDDNLAEILQPDADQLVFGEVWIKAAATHASIGVSHASFSAVRNYNGQTVWTGYDTDGTDITYGPYAPSPEGDGWSGYWPTSSRPDGYYTLHATLTTSLGSFSDSRQVWLDTTPPIPSVDQPAFGARCSGTIEVRASGASGATQCEFAVQNVPPIVKLKTTDILQGDYPFPTGQDKNTCHPSSQASILWSEPRVKNWYTNTDKRNPTHSEADGLRNLVRDLECLKGTQANGTNDSTASIGSGRLLKLLKSVVPGWQYQNLADMKTMKKLKAYAFINDTSREVKGLAVSVTYKNAQNQTCKHIMAVKEISDVPETRNGKKVFKVTVMDSGTGKEEVLYVDESGNVEYKGGQAKLDGGYRYVGPKATQGMPVGDSDWEVIGVDVTPGDGWSCSWNLSTETPGCYLVRARATEPSGRSGEDVSEVIVPLVCALDEAKNQIDGMPVDVTGSAVTHVDGNKLWVESTGRSCGIGVLADNPTVSRERMITKIAGQVVTEGLERTIVAQSIVPATDTFQVKPLGMLGRSVVGGDLDYDPVAGTGQQGGPGACGLNNVGMLVRVCGRCTGSEVGPDEQTYYIVDDGSSLNGWPSGGVRVLVTDSVNTYQFVLATGICGIEDWDGKIVAVVRCRDAEDWNCFD